MKNTYTIEELENIFKEHAEIFEIEEKIRREKWPHSYETPNFNISKALQIICNEILKMR